MASRPSAETAVEGTSEKPAIPASSAEAVKAGDKKAVDGSQVQVSTVGRDGFYDPKQETVWTRLGLTAESFKRAPGTTGGQTDPMLQQQMKNRHLNMIAVGGSIGTGLFIGSGSALGDGGPLGILIAWIIMGVMLLNTCQAIGEMAIMYPVSGGFYTLISRFVDPSWGFAMGWNYWFQWAVTLPLELTAAAFTIQFWDTQGTVNIAVWITIFTVLIFILNVFGTWGFAEEEFWSSCLKLITIAIFLIASLVFVLGGGPKSGDYGSYWGARLWHDPGALANGFPGVCAVFVTAAFSFAGTELVGLAATEHPNPIKALPSAIKMTFWRITFVFVLSLMMVGFLVPYNDERLIGGSYDANTSPFVLVFRNANVSGLPDFINAVITVSVLSIGMSCVYGGSRTMLAMAEQGYAPKFFTYVDKAGRPLWALASVLVFFPLAYINIADVGTTVFDWLIAVSGLATIFTWLSINIAHIRFRMAWKAQGYSVDELPFRALGGIWGSVLGATILILVLIAQVYIAIWPLGGVSSSSERAESFFMAYLALPIVIAFYLVGLIWLRRKPKGLLEIDLVSGRKCHYSADELNEQRAKRKQWPLGKRIIHALFQ
ncbi:amino-acid permease inda1 [Cystobasidium minutum MCA 4210]|uniref:amino-acid permease inda1 n=1 Tax=Cystobasidium minutum MCA 4210 TaxID=1397322 RepID=UPI0034CEE17B|eukprot:jgi/Rhomi1/184477/fgenesh1_pm.8_\